MIFIGVTLWGTSYVTADSTTSNTMLARWDQKKVTPCLSPQSADVAEL